MSIKTMKVTDRDNEVLKIMLKYGATNKNLLVKIYGDDYYKKRLIVLKTNKYIIKIRNGIYALGIEGQKYFENKGIEVIRPKNIEIVHYERYADASYVGYMLDNWEFMGSRESKIKYNLNRGLRILGIIENENRKILVFKLPNKIGKIGIEKYKKELANIKSYGYVEAIVLSNSDNAKELFGIDSCNLNNLYMMPDEDISLLLINSMANINTSDWIISQIYDVEILYRSSMKMYDFENDSEYIFSMADYNIAKIDYVLDHIEIIKEKLSKKKEIVCICFEGQISEIKKMFGREAELIIFKTLENEKLIELIKLA